MTLLEEFERLLARLEVEKQSARNGVQARHLAVAYTHTEDAYFRLKGMPAAVDAALHYPPGARAPA